MAAVFWRPAARHDLVEHYVYLAENAGEQIADRFLASVESTFAGLTEYQEMGATLRLRRPELTGLRKWQVKDFDKFLIFYLPRDDGVSIVRLLHAAQDWWGLLDIDA